MSKVTRLRTYKSRGHWYRNIGPQPKAKSTCEFGYHSRCMVIECKCTRATCQCYLNRENLPDNYGSIKDKKTNSPA